MLWEPMCTNLSPTAVFGIVFVPLGSHGLSIPDTGFELNIYTGPGYVGVVLGVINLIVIIIFFSDTRLVNRETRKKIRDEIKQNNMKISKMKGNRFLCFTEGSTKEHYDRFGAFATMVVFVVIVGGYITTET